MNENMNKQEKIESIKIQHNASIIEALKTMDATFRRLLLVFNNNSFVNILSIGDIQRAILKNVLLDSPISNILRKETLISSQSEPLEVIEKRMLDQRIECMPILDSDNKLVDVIFWEDVFTETNKPIKNTFNLPVVIMAGGEGTRLRPITHVLPKALIPVGEESILERIIKSFLNYGSNEFYISVNYKANMIRQYIDDINNKQYSVSYLTEDKPLGTAGALHDLKGKIDGNFFVTNCDILIQNDYSEILDYHTNNQNDLTVVAALKHYAVPYGVLETEDNGRLTKLTEKPEFTYKINSGMYILNSKVLDYIPQNKYFHMTHLIEEILSRNGNVGVFPVSEKSWIDIGDWHHYLKNNLKK
ncbi:MAG: nucleotidyltransferase family protein [Bacteroidales bacterium]